MKQVLCLQTQPTVSPSVQNDTDYLNNVLGQVPTSEEIKAVIPTYISGKSPGPNGFQLTFIGLI